MRYCTNCGAEIKDGSKFCTSCGKEVNSGMTLEKAIHSFFEHYLDHSGRAGRREFFYIFTSRFFVFFALNLLIMTIFRNIIIIKNALVIAYMAFVLLTFLPYIMLCIRRLHDSGKSGAWLLIYTVPCIGPFWFLFLLFKEGDKTPNLYGPATEE